MHTDCSIDSVQTIGAGVSLHCSISLRSELKLQRVLSKQIGCSKHPTGVKALTLSTRASMIAVVSFLYASNFQSEALRLPLVAGSELSIFSRALSLTDSYRFGPSELFSCSVLRLSK